MAGVDELFPRAVAAQRDGDLVSAERDYREILAIDPQHAISLSNLGVILGRRGELDEAIAASESAIRADPNLAVAHFNLGNIYRQVNRLADAAKSYQRVVQLTPGFAQGYLSLGLVLRELGNLSAAIEHLERAVQSQPGIVDGLLHLGETLAQAGRTDQAIATLQSAIDQTPTLPRNHLALARALFAADRADAAIQTLEHALRLQPNHAVVHNFLGIVLDKCGRFDEAQPHFREAIRIRPDFAGAWSNLGLSLRDQGRSTEAAEAFAKSIELRPDPVAASNRLLALMNSLSAEALLEEHRKWAATHAAGPHQVVGPTTQYVAGERLKIGYVFGEFASSAISAFLESILVRHDRAKFHVTCYANTSRESEAIGRLRKLADDWHSLANLDDNAACELIRFDQIDVLVDLNGHSVGNRLLVFAQKPARVQVSLFGYPFTTGLEAIDYRLSDGVADPPGTADDLSVEKILRLPETGRIYVPPTSAPLPSTLPALRQKVFTFGCLSRLGKLSDACLETWANILQRMANSRLVIQSGRSAETARCLSDRFARLGIEPNRVFSVYYQDEHDYFRAYQSIDVALDPFPFNGRATTCDALWMGVPVLSLAGQDSRSRQGLSILTSIGLSDFVAETPDKLVKLAMVWVEQTDALAELRPLLREMMLQSPLSDAAAYVRNLEAAFATAAIKSHR